MNRGAGKTRWTTALAYGAERVIALSLAMILLRSSWAHWGNMYYFLDTIFGYRMVGLELGVLAAAVLSFMQVTLAGSLLLRCRVREGYGMVIGLLLVYGIAQGAALYRGLDIACGFFGAAGSWKVGWGSLAVTGASLAGAISGLYLAHHSGKKTSGTNPQGAGP